EPKSFCRAFLSKDAKSDSVESNNCESFNNAIVRFRDLRVIKMLEGIRSYIMLSGVPCMHAIAAISYMRYDINHYIHEWYSVQLARKAYTKGIPALPGREDWKEVDGNQADHNVRGCKMTPEEALNLPKPPPPKPVGRPRRRPLPEPQPEEGTAEIGSFCLLQQGGRRRKVQCKHCKHLGHNIRGCPVRRGVQLGAVNNITPRNVVEREIRRAMRGVGVHVSPETGNQYFAVG
ncbi:hypothetical protein LINPERPRIM_LOCUS13244, partial [Linum perenne]